MLTVEEGIFGGIDNSQTALTIRIVSDPHTMRYDVKLSMSGQELSRKRPFSQSPNALAKKLGSPRIPGPREDVFSWALKGRS
ncbi:unnamed protein product [Euphydryas editha]|uniref:Uncharacterized protein n=1 Tax=Euphydryas editha TaxID=104508 RepID=A0AAU9TZW5_EUPED|nr:unnamed protein product [Euphydryas editha]